MSFNWEIRPLGELAKFSSGGTPSKKNPEYWNGTIPWISAKAMKYERVSTSDLMITEEGLESGSKLAPVGSLLLLTRGSGLFNGIPLCIVERPVAFNQDVKCIDSRSDVDNLFIFYWLKSQEQYLKAKLEVTGIGAGKFDTKFLQELNIPIPPQEERDKIVAILEAISKKIIVNAKMIDNLQQQAAAMYKSWFVDFSFSDEHKMVESEIGKIPCDWRVYRLSEFLPVITGKKNANVSSPKGEYPFFSCSQDFAWTIDYSFEGHAILVSGNGDFNVKWYKGKFEAYQRTYVLIPYEERFTSWLYYAVKYNLAKITSAARGSVIKFITKGNLEDFAFAAPSDLCSCEIIDNFAAINRKIDCLTQENYRLAAIRDTLLPRLMSGEIDVSDIKI